MPIALVTGADGFIGSRLVELLVKKGYKIKALSQYNSFNNWGWIEDIECKDKIEVLTGDIRDPHYCKFIAKDMDIKTVVIDPLGATLNPGKDLYFDLIRNMSTSFKGC